MKRDKDEQGLEPPLFSLPEMIYQNLYLWFILVSSMDIMLTWRILRGGGHEVNPVAKLVIDSWGLPGAILFKFALMLFVIIACEIIGRKKVRTGRILIIAAISISSIPVAWSFWLILYNMVIPAVSR
ncbi:MAG: hypothetical protein CMJ32_03595 [Phycisphaerae bacterium]|nr:hypothetical protein [Phycisphaerae bacterium]